MFSFVALLFLAACGGGPKIEGSWSLEAVSGEELSESEKAMVFTFNEDGSLVMSNGEREEKGSWAWSEDKKDIILKNPNRDGEEKMEGVTIDGDVVKFKSRSDEITLKRKK